VAREFQPDDPAAGGTGAKPADLRRGLVRTLLILLAVVVVLAIVVALTNIGGDDDPSGGGEQGMGSAVTLLAPAG
jgi:hypothetical protein